MTGTDDDGIPVKDDDPATVTITDVPATIVVDKTANPTSVPEPGGPVTFTVLVTNTSVTDDVTFDVPGDFTDKVGVGPVEAITDVDCNGAAPGQGFPITLQEANAGTTDQVTCTFVKHVPGNAGAQITDLVEVTGTDDDGNPVKDDDPATVTITDVPATIVVDKTANPTSVAEPGGPVTFTVLVTNTSVTDDVTFDVPGDFTDKVGVGPVEAITDIDCNGAAPGQGFPITLQEANAGTTDQVTCTFVKNVSGNAGAQVTDLVEVTGTDDDGNPVKDDDPATVTITDVPATIVVDKTANPTSVPEPGGPVTFTVLVTNTSVTDDVTFDVPGDFTDKVGVGPVEAITDVDCNGAAPGQGFPITLQEANAGTTDQVTCTFVKNVSGNAGAGHGLGRGDWHRRRWQPGQGRRSGDGDDHGCPGDDRGRQDCEPDVGCGAGWSGDLHGPGYEHVGDR